jgi:hypothetical protein
LAAAGFELAVRRITVPPGVNMAVLHDPNGVRVELIDLGGMEDPVSAG